jgi:outer membrane autotransporter protein
MEAITSRNLFTRAEDNGVPTGLAAGSGAQTSSVWGQVMGFESRLNSQVGTAGDSASSGGLGFGADHLINDRVRLGGSFAYGRTTVDGRGTDSGSRTNIDSYQVTAYGSYNGGPWYVNGQVGGGVSHYDQSRALVFAPTAAKASFDGDGVIVHVDGGRDYQMGAVRLTPVAGLTYSYQDIHAFTESVTGESFGSSGISSVQSDLGVQASWRMRMATSILQPTVKLSWVHDFIRSPLETTEAIGGVTFSTASQRSALDGAHLGLALTMLNQANWQLQAQYDGALYSNYSSNALALNLKVNF